MLFNLKNFLILCLIKDFFETRRSDLIFEDTFLVYCANWILLPWENKTTSEKYEFNSCLKLIIERFGRG